MDSDYCTICEKNVNFIPKRSRTKCSCPGCGSKERHRLIALYLKEYKILNNEKKYYIFVQKNAFHKFIKNMIIILAAI